ncbi:4-hydroxy-tetrahydrodipicolinate reductase [Qipengyuania nanhaisediminis]|uniref:4-hydroxy-tetrahydrodipicolinate reductase n=1 Tax=Qipengyuania nanhaisediminis TaxID=604088 RepID=UPI0038B3D8C0
MAQFAVIGHKGRMGAAIEQALADAGETLGAGIDEGDDVGDALGGCEGVIDFSAPAALEANLAAARAASLPILVGTTGLETSHHALIDEAARTIPVLQTGNTSLGVTLMAHLVREAAQRLGPDWDIEVLEMHHRAKVDAPSGTAMLLGEAAAEARGIALGDHMESGRHGQTGARGEGTIGFAALRGGTVAGDHSVIFAGSEERLTIAHSAENRMIFARGAVRAGRWLIGKAPGRYTMGDVLAL